jgi:hypothetical protein
VEGKLLLSVLLLLTMRKGPKILWKFCGRFGGGGELHIWQSRGEEEEEGNGAKAFGGRRERQIGRREGEAHHHNTNQPHWITSFALTGSLLLRWLC